MRQRKQFISLLCAVGLVGLLALAPRPDRDLADQRDGDRPVGRGRARAKVTARNEATGVTYNPGDHRRRPLRFPSLPSGSTR